MTASQHTPSARRAAWQATRRVARALRAARDEQVRMWEAWLQENRAAVPEAGPLSWVLTLGGLRLAGSHLPIPDDAAADGRP
jgi:hypothetical protein